MLAKDARLLTEESLKGPAISSLLETAYKRIEEAAKQGKDSVSHPFYNVYPFPTPELVEAALLHLRRLGYSVIHSPNPDPQDPRSSSWDEVRW